jgi:hypothetical protein
MELEKRDEADEQKTYELVREAECKLAQIIVQARIPFTRNATTKPNTWVRNVNAARQAFFFFHSLATKRKQKNHLTPRDSFSTAFFTVQY